MKIKRIALYLLILIILTNFITCSKKENPNEFVFCEIDESSYPVYASNNAGVLTIVNGVRVLSLKGTHYEMGFAHGEIMACEIVNLFNDIYIKDTLGSMGVTLDYLNAIIKPENLNIPEKYFDEARGMYAGLAASGKSLYIPEINRNITLNDVMMSLIFSDLRAMGCSAFSAWNTLTSDRSLITGRNLETFYPSSKEHLNKQMIISSDGTESGEDKERVISINFPGMIPVFTGINSKGIMVSLNSADGIFSLAGFNLKPVCIAMKEILENSDSYSGFDIYISDFFKSYAFAIPAIVLATSPYNNPANLYPAIAMEIDSNDIVSRYPSDNVRTDHIIACNNFIKRSIDGEGSNTDYRYAKISAAIADFSSTGDSWMDENEFKETLASVSSNLINHGTIVSLIFSSQGKIFQLSLAKYLNGDVQIATKTDWTEFSFDQLFLME